MYLNMENTCIYINMQIHKLKAYIHTKDLNTIYIYMSKYSILKTAKLQTNV